MAGSVVGGPIRQLAVGPKQLSDGFRWQSDRITAAHSGASGQGDYGRNTSNGQGFSLVETHGVERGPLRMEDKMKYGLLWLLGVPIPILIILYFLF